MNSKTTEGRKETHMKNYRDFEKKYIGSSDIASLTFRAGNDVFPVNFGSDGSYDAYIVRGEAEIGEHYTLVHESKFIWLHIFDDSELTFKDSCYNAKSEDRYDTIRVYRAGEFGCIIQFLKTEIND